MGLETERDRHYMGLALRLAARGVGRTRPNPVVGCVVVAENRIVGRGWHRRAGSPHAEVEALAQAGELARGAEVFVTLEPCCHFGRTPPCVDALLAAGVKRVVAAMTDPNPKVAGQGLKKLQAAGIQVDSGVLREEAESLNRPFITWITEHRPMVTLKAAASLDGKIATRGGESRWITGEAARLRAHRLRDLHDVVGVGIGTVVADNPRLNTRTRHGRDPIRLVVDSTMRIDEEAAIFFSSATAPLWIATTHRAPAEKMRTLTHDAPRVSLLVCREDNGRVELEDLLTQLADREITSLLVEGGGTLADGFLARKLVDRMVLFLSPRLFGGQDAPGIWNGQGVEHLSQGPRLSRLRVEMAGEDMMIQGDVSFPERGETQPG